jgi:hypothetical protein
MTQRYAHLSQSHKMKAMSVLSGMVDGHNSHDESLEEGFSNKGNKPFVTILSQSEKFDFDEIRKMSESVSK